MSKAILPAIIVGIDTHKHTHTAVALTGAGARVGELTIRVDLGGYRELAAWARSLGAVRAFGVAGSYGVGWRASSARPAIPSTRRAVPIAGCATGMARRTTLMPKAPLAPCSADKPRPCPRPAPARWR
jgi:hypothetical protein